jgi:mannose-1-phosphate guanylyltransferase
LVVHD